MATIVTGTASDDVHVIGIRLVEMALRRVGHQVVSLGALVPTSDFVEAVVESNADAVFVSSLNGHAQLTLTTLRDALTEAGRRHVLLYGGGQLVIGRPPWEDVCGLFVDRLGFDRVYPSDVSLDRVLEDLESDLADRPAARGPGR
jgi:methylaspartate mutase sigma subunit